MPKRALLLLQALIYSEIKWTKLKLMTVFMFCKFKDSNRNRCDFRRRLQFLFASIYLLPHENTYILRISIGNLTVLTWLSDSKKVSQGVYFHFAINKCSRTQVAEQVTIATARTLSVRIIIGWKYWWNK